MKHDYQIANRMFLIGCLGLPWLWFLNILYFRKKVYGSIPFLDTEDEEETTQNNNNNSIEIPNLNNEEEKDDEPCEISMSPEEMEMELRKWVHRSTVGFVTATVLFTSWIITFQLNRDYFGPNWLYMSQDEG